MIYLQDAGRVFAESAKKTLRSIQYILPLMLVQFGLSIVLRIVMDILVRTIGGGGLLGGIFFALIQAAMWSLYLYVVSHAVFALKLSTQDIKQGLGVYFRDVYSAAFVLYILQILFGMLTIPYIDLFLILVLSALPETIYLARTSGFENIRESIDFLKENWYIWLPFTVLALFLLQQFGMGISLFIPVSIRTVFMTLIPAMIHCAMFAFFAIWRGQLYRILYGSNIRKRAFMAKFK